MRRRDLMAALGGAAAAWPFALRAQKKATPVIGFLSSRTPGDAAIVVAAFHQGLAETGYVEGPPMMHLCDIRSTPTSGAS